MRWPGFQVWWKEVLFIGDGQLEADSRSAAQFGETITAHGAGRLAPAGLPGPGLYVPSVAGPLPPPDPSVVKGTPLKELLLKFRLVDQMAMGCPFLWPDWLRWP